MGSFPEMYSDPDFFRALLCNETTGDRAVGHGRITLPLKAILPVRRRQVILSCLQVETTNYCSVQDCFYDKVSVPEKAPGLECNVSKVG